VSFYFINESVNVEITLNSDKVML